MRNGHSRREFLVAAAGGLMASGGAGYAQGVPAGTRSAIEPFECHGVRLLDGPFKKQFDCGREFYLGLADDDLLKGFRQRAGRPSPGKDLVGWYAGDPGQMTWWSGGDAFNAFGQFVSGMVRLAKTGADPRLRDKATGLIREWAKTIAPDGYFYYSNKPRSPHYFYDKLMYALVDAYQWGDCREAQPLMERITAWAVKNLDRSRKKPLDGVDMSADGQEWYTLSENLYRAYGLTGNSAFRDFGDVWRYHHYWRMFSSDAPPAPFGYHAYSHVNTLSGAAMAYAVSGEDEYLRTIVKAYDWLERTQMYASGGFGPSEKLVRPDGSLGASLEQDEHTFETVCGAWGGFKLGRYLMMFTGEARYGDWIEKLLYNAIGAALPVQSDGRNFYYSDYRIRGGRKVYHPEWKWACCSGTYPQVIADCHNVIYFHDASNLYVNLLLPSEVTWRTASGVEVRVRQQTVYPESDTSAFTISPDQPADFGLKFRVPGWSSGMALEVNGESVAIVARPGTWASLERHWRPGDTVKIRIPMQLHTVPVDPQHPQRVAVMYGPVVLVKQESSLLVPGHDPANWMTQEGAGLRFRLLKQGRDAFVPFYAIGHNEPYCMYFDLRA
jgi:DUF1680 family protein